jgi:hypothetical protein
MVEYSKKKNPPKKYFKKTIRFFLPVISATSAPIPSDVVSSSPGVGVGAATVPPNVDTNIAVSFSSSDKLVSCCCLVSSAGVVRPTWTRNEPAACPPRRRGSVISSGAVIVFSRPVCMRRPPPPLPPEGTRTAGGRRSCKWPRIKLTAGWAARPAATDAGGCWFRFAGGECEPAETVVGMRCDGGGRGAQAGPGRRSCIAPLVVTMESRLRSRCSRSLLQSDPSCTQGKVILISDRNDGVQAEVTLL